MFSSPAIEAHLHRIPGLSKKFIYFNDDVFLGAPTKPEDFVSVSGVQKFHLAWDVPKCAPGCSDSWIGDGFCDRACNVSACNFDYPDCSNATSPGWQSGNSGDQPNSKPLCSKGCPDSWLGDKVCDARCKNADCAWDMGDCGIGKVIDDFPGVRLSRLNSRMNMMTGPFRSFENNPIDNDNSSLPDLLQVSSFFSNLSSIAPAISVPLGTKAVYFNVSALRLALLMHSDDTNFRFISANHTSSDLIHSATVLTRHSALLVALYSDQEEKPTVPVLPHRVAFQVRAENTITNASVVAEFVLEVSQNMADIYKHKGYPTDAGFVVRGYSSACALPKSSSEMQGQLLLRKVDLADRPFSVSDWGTDMHADPVVGVALILAIGNVSPELRNLPMSRIFAKFKVTSRTRIFEKVVPLCAAIGEVNSGSYVFQRCYSSNVGCPETFGLLVQQQALLETHNGLRTRFDPNSSVPRLFIGGDSVTYLTLLIPVPNVFASEQKQWIHSKVELIIENAISSSPSKILAEDHGVYSSKKYINRGAFRPTTTSEERIVEINNHLCDTLLCTSASFKWGQSKDYQPSASASVRFFGGNRNRRLRRRLEEDTYAQSLIHVNRLYTKRFGSEARKVPAHLPHMIDRDSVQEMQDIWANEWNTTSSHRFRSQKDMQFAFSYYYYVIHRHLIQDIDVKRFISENVDTNKDGLIDDNEFRTLTAIARSDIYALHNCTLNASDSSLIHNEKVQHSFPYGTAESSLAIKLWPTVHDVMKCELVVKGILDNFDRKGKFQTHTTTSDKDVAFEMISDNYTLTLSQLDSIRMRQSKFICINDNMKEPSVKLMQALKDFFEAFWPTPSRFELPYGTRNAILEYDKYVLARSDGKLENAKWTSPTLELFRTELRRIQRVGKTLFVSMRRTVLKWAQRVFSTFADKIVYSLSEEPSTIEQQRARQRNAEAHRFHHDHASDVVVLDNLVLLGCCVFFIGALCIIRTALRESHTGGLKSEEVGDREANSRGKIE